MKLYPHQEQALQQTANQNRVAYYLDMGLGKTFVGSEKMMQLDGRINLVICQKSKVQDWFDHFKLHHEEAGWLEVFDLTKDIGNFWEFAVGKWEGEIDHIVGIINYDLIFRRPELAKVAFDTIMLDESSLIQNEQSKRSRFILKRLRHKNCILLSGTPTGGKYERLWSQCRLLGWEISKTAFWNTYVNFHFQEFNGFPQKVIDGYKNVERLKRKLREHGAVFMKSDEVFELPEQITSTVHVATSKEYRKFQKTYIVEVKDKELIGDTALTALLYSRMLCGAYNSEKLAAFRDLLDSTDDRLIVFYNFIDELQALTELAKVAGRPYSIVSGSTKDLSEYENSEDSVTFVQYQAGAMGLNLQKANKLVYFTPPLSSELFEQSKKRIHRIGQNRQCWYYRLVCRGSVEERIYSTLEMRKDYTEKLFEEVKK